MYDCWIIGLAFQLSLGWRTAAVTTASKPAASVYGQASLLFTKLVAIANYFTQTSLESTAS